MRPRLVGPAVGLMLLSPAAAEAFGPGPAVELGAGARCLRSTGAPGELLLQAPRARRFATDVRHGLDVVQTVQLGLQTGCAEGAHAGRRVLAAPVRLPDATSAIAVAIGDDPVEWLGVPARTSVSALHVAAAADGRVAVGWVQTTYEAGLVEPRSSQRVLVARAGPGGALGAPEVLAGPRTGGFEAGEADLDLAYAPDETLLAAVARPLAPVHGDEGTFGDLARIELRRAPAGEPFAPPEVLDPQRQGRPELDLSVAADGSVLVAAAGNAVAAWGGPAGAPLTRLGTLVSQDLLDPARQTPAPVAETGAVLGTPGSVAGPAVAAAPGGAGLLVYRLGERGAGSLTLGPNGVPSPPRTILPPELDPGTTNFSSGISITEVGDGPAAIDVDPRPQPQVVLAPDGRAAVALSTDEEHDDLRSGAAAGTLTDGLRRATPLIGAPRALSGVAALLAADGTPTVAVADESRRPGPHDGRLALSSAGLPGPSATAAPPAVRLVGPARLTTRGARPLTLQVACAAACDLGVDVGGRPLGRGRAAGQSGASLPRAGIASVPVGVYEPLITSGTTARVPVRLIATAPRGLRATTVRGAFALRQRAPLPAPGVIDLRLHRRGRQVEVSLRLVPSGPRYAMSVLAIPTGAREEPGYAVLEARGGGRYTGTLTLPRGRLRDLDLSGFPYDPGRQPIRRKLPVPAR